MKLQCKKCGKKEAELMSKAEIKMNSFLANKLFNVIDDLLRPKYIVCKACGHYEEA